MNVLPPTGTPEDMRDLLVRLDERSAAQSAAMANGFQAINAKLDAGDRRADAHEARLIAVEGKVTSIETSRAPLIVEHNALRNDVAALETWQTAVTTTAKTAGVGAVVLRWIGGGLFGIALVILAAFLANYFAVQQADKLAHPAGITAPKG